MDKIKILWVARDKYGSLSLFTEEPFSADGEWFSIAHIGQIEDGLIDEIVTYEDSPKQVLLSCKRIGAMIR